MGLKHVKNPGASGKHNFNYENKAGCVLKLISELVTFT